MCYWVGTKKVREIIKKRKESGLWDNIDQAFYDNFIARTDKEFIERYIAFGHSQPTLTTLAMNEGGVSFENMIWSLPTYFYDKAAGGMKEGNLLPNVTCEKVFSLFSKPSLTKRCLIPIDGYFEYYHLGKEVYPHFIYPKNPDDIFFVGGVWDNRTDKDTGEKVAKFSMITTPPNPFVAKIHNNPKAPNGSRMLLLVPRERTEEFLDPKLTKEQVASFFKPYDESLMQSHTVLRFQRVADKEILKTGKVCEPLVYPELSPTLF
jgi:putative SOS response-associated peptidase YedK